MFKLMGSGRLKLQLLFSLKKDGAPRVSQHKKHLLNENLFCDFGSGNINSLVAIKCLDEGIDIPACERAFFLASSSNRVSLFRDRTDFAQKPWQEKSIIYDFRVCLERFKLIRLRNSSSKKGERVIEFSSSAINRIDCYSKLRPILQEYGLEGYL